MTAEAAKDEGTAGSANVRRAVLEVTRAVSLTPWHGDVTFNAASPGATPSAQKKGRNPVPYGTEVHATRYQFGFAMTPDRLRDRSRAAKAITALGSLRTVAGNHGRFLYDFSPDAIVIRISLLTLNRPDTQILTGASGHGDCVLRDSHCGSESRFSSTSVSWSISGMPPIDRTTSANTISRSRPG